MASHESCFPGALCLTYKQFPLKISSPQNLFTNFITNNEDENCEICKLSEIPDPFKFPCLPKCYEPSFTLQKKKGF